MNDEPRTGAKLFVARSTRCGRCESSGCNLDTMHFISVRGQARMVLEKTTTVIAMNTRVSHLFLPGDHPSCRLQCLFDLHVGHSEINPLLEKELVGLLRFSDCFANTISQIRGWESKLVGCLDGQQTVDNLGTTGRNREPLDCFLHTSPPWVATTCL